MKRLLLGMVAACMATSMVAQDPATYEKAGEYTLENLWMKAATTGNNMGVADQLGVLHLGAAEFDSFGQGRNVESVFF